MRRFDSDPRLQSSLKFFRPSDMTHRWQRYVLSFLIATLTSSARSQAAVPRGNDGAWVLAWSDEFDGPNGSPVDPTKWVAETGGDGWGNHELEYYTSRPQNVYRQDGNLVIKAVAEKYSGPDGVTRDYTSARLKTLGKFAQTYGRF